MSKKLLRSRIDGLFSAFEEQDVSSEGETKISAPQNETPPSVQAERHTDRLEPTLTRNDKGITGALHLEVYNPSQAQQSPAPAQVEDPVPTPGSTLTTRQELPDQPATMVYQFNYGEKGKGTLKVENENPGHSGWSEDETLLVKEVVDQLALAIENAQAYSLAQKAVEEMREIDRLKSQFLANMSHELRTPLNSIIGFSRVIIKGIDGPVNETQQQDLGAIYNSGLHLLNLINDILDLSKIEAGKMELTLDAVDLKEMILSVMSTASGLIKGKPIRLTHNISPGLTTVIADATRVRQVLINLVSNAAKFTEQGEISIKAKVRESQGHQEAVITVHDTGPGIALEDQGKLFQPFSQVDDSPTRKTGGTGLGLSICRSLIEMHGGKIGLLSSALGKGSVFYFTLPLEDQDKPVEPVPAPQAAPASDTIVLAVDDDPRVAGLYQRYLRPSGYEVIPLKVPHEAVELARKLKPFAITLDIMMHDRDGWQVLRDLKNHPETRSIPVIVCSILDQQDKALQLGASGYLVKPFLQDDLLAVIAQLKNHTPKGSQLKA